VASLVRYSPAATYVSVGLGLACLGMVGLLFGRDHTAVMTPSVALILVASTLLAFALRSPIEIRDSHLQVGRRVVPWESISHVHPPHAVAPLALPLTLNSHQNYLLLYPGTRENGRKLLHQIRRHARFALIDGLPYRQYWDEDLEAFRERCLSTDQLWNVLSLEDEEEVERLFLKLRSEGTLHRRESEGLNS